MVSPNEEASAPLWVVLLYVVAALVSADDETALTNYAVSKLVERGDDRVGVASPSHLLSLREDGVDSL